jgi:hypothetical protein
MAPAVFPSLRYTNPDVQNADAWRDARHAGPDGELQVVTRILETTERWQQ